MTKTNQRSENRSEKNVTPMSLNRLPQRKRTNQFTATKNPAIKTDAYPLRVVGQDIEVAVPPDETPDVEQSS